MCSTLRIMKTFVENISGIYSSDMFKVQSKPEFLRHNLQIVTTILGTINNMKYVKASKTLVSFLYTSQKS